VLRCIFLTLTVVTALAAPSTVAVVVGTGTGGYSDSQVNNPYGLVVGPDGGLYFCDLDNQRVRRLDLRTRQLTTIAGNGERGYRGDGGAAVDASLNMPHELRFDRRGDLFVVERDSHVVRKIDMRTRVIITVAGTGTPGFSGDGGPATAARISAASPDCIEVAADVCRSLSGSHGSPSDRSCADSPGAPNA